MKKLYKIKDNFDFSKLTLSQFNTLKQVYGEYESAEESKKEYDELLPEKRKELTEMNMFLSKIDNKNKNYDLLIKERDKTLKNIESFIDQIEYYSDTMIKEIKQMKFYINKMV